MTHIPKSSASAIYIEDVASPEAKKTHSLNQPETFYRTTHLTGLFSADV